MFNETAYDLAIGAGCSPDNAATAAAIAQAESSGNASAYNGVGKDNSYGLWQINMIGNLGPARRAQFGLSSNAQLLDPATNARAMYAVSNGCTSFSPWSTFTSGIYQKFLQAFSGSPSASNGTTPIDSTSSTLDFSNVLDFSGGNVTTDQTPTDLLSSLPGGGLAVLALLAAAYFILR
jgi:Lysozyme like domain